MALNNFSMTTELEAEIRVYVKPVCDITGESADDYLSVELNNLNNGYVKKSVVEKYFTSIKNNYIEQT